MSTNILTNKSYKTIGDEIWKNRMDKVSGELFILTYGSIVTQLIHDLQSNYQLVNQYLDKMGYNMGTRLIDEYLAKSQLGRCRDFNDTSQVITKVAFRMFLNISPTVTNVSSDGKSFSIILDDNPLAELVELPDNAKPNNSSSSKNNNNNNTTTATTTTTTTTTNNNNNNNTIEPNSIIQPSDSQQQQPLWYSNILCGIIRGALEMIQLQVQVNWVSDVLHGDDINEIRVSLIRILEDEVPAGDD